MSAADVLANVGLAIAAAAFSLVTGLVPGAQRRRGRHTAA